MRIVVCIIILIVIACDNKYSDFHSIRSKSKCDKLLSNYPLRNITCRNERDIIGRELHFNFEYSELYKKLDNKILMITLSGGYIYKGAFASEIKPGRVCFCKEDDVKELWNYPGFIIIDTLTNNIDWWATKNGFDFSCEEIIKVKLKKDRFLIKSESDWFWKD